MTPTPKWLIDLLDAEGINGADRLAGLIWRNLTNPDVVVTEATVRRFWARVDQSGDCWIWTGIRTSLGYGRLHIAGKAVPAHRISYILSGRTIPDGLVLDHLCRQPSCVNPEHLRPLSSLENLMIGEGPSAKNARKTHCEHGHEFTPENTRISSDKKGRTRRHCRECSRESDRRRYWAGKQSSTAERMGWRTA